MLFLKISVSVVNLRVCLWVCKRKMDNLSMLLITSATSLRLPKIIWDADNCSKQWPLSFLLYICWPPHLFAYCSHFERMTDRRRRPQHNSMVSKVKQQAANNLDNFFFACFNEILHFNTWGTGPMCERWFVLPTERCCKVEPSGLFSVSGRACDDFFLGRIVIVLVVA